jgi:hypothetical protein
MAARLWTSLVRLLGLGAALAASGALLAVPPSAPKTAHGPVPAAMAWPRAQHAVTLANLPDGTAYRPAIFLDARTSVGTATTRDGKSLRLLLVSADQPVRQLRNVPFTQNPSFQTFAVAGTDVLLWAEGARGKIQIWRADLRDRRGPQQLTSDAGDATFYQSQYDLIVNAGNLYWVAVRKDDATEVRSIALTGGPVDTRTVPGNWTLSAWPWLVNGITAASGTTLLRNLSTDQDVPVAGTGSRSVTRCSPTWCQVATLSHDGTNRIDLMHPDGSGRQRVAGDTAETVIADVTPLDRYEVYSEIGPESNLTGNVRLLAFELATRRTVEISPDAGRVSYRNGVLSWATGNQNTFIWHALDLRTI